MRQETSHPPMPAGPAGTRVGIGTRRIWILSFPIIIAGISETILEITDAIFLGHYGVVELAAVGLADAIYEVLIVASIGVSEGIQIVVARRLGQKRHDEIGATFNQGLYLLGILSALVFLFLQFLVPLVTSVVVSGDEVRAAVNAFLRVIAWGVAFDALNLAFGAFYVGLTRSRVLIGATVVLALVNIVLDYGLIFGNLGFPELGIRGAAMASVAAEAGAFLYILGYAVNQGDLRRYGLLRFRRWNARISSRLVTISSPIALEVLVHSGRWLVFFVFVGYLGTAALAGASVIYSCYVVLLLPIGGISEAVSSLVSALIGEGRTTRIWILLRRSMVLSILTTLPVILAALVFPDLIMGIFTDDAAVIELSRNSLWVIALAILLAIPGELLLGAVTGSGDTGAAFVIELVLSAVVLAGSAIALWLGLPLEYLWGSLIIGWLLRILMSWLRLRDEAWRELEI